MKIPFCCFCFTCLELMGVCSVFGQTSNPDSSFLAAAINNLTQKYATTLENNGHLYNGKEYVNYDKYYMRGHQFYKSDEEQEGAVYYEDYLFTNVPLLYDVVLDQIVIAEPNGALQFKLENTKVSYFKVHGHLFVRLTGDTLGQATVRPGFYDLLANGKTKLLARRSKRMTEEPTPRGMEGEYLITDKFFIQKNNIYYPVSSKKSFLGIFPEKKKELQKHIRTQRLKFRKENREAALVELVHYYDTLPN